MNIKLNKIVKYLVFSDLIFYSGWGLISPIFAIFIVNNISGGSAFVAGMAAAINLIVRSILRIPFGICSDKSEKTAYNFMFWGLLFAALIPIGYVFSSNFFHIYILQAILGASLAMSTAGWTRLFSRHMDSGKESTEWGVDAVAVGLGPGIAAALGGFAITYFSFAKVFFIVAICGVIGALLLLIIKKDVLGNHKHNSQVLAPLEIRRLKKARIA